MFFSTEITSSKIASDKPLLVRTRKAYEFIENEVHGNVLEIGCGDCYKLDKIYERSDQLFLLDKSRHSLKKSRAQLPDSMFVHSCVSKITEYNLPQMDHIICFQFIEHVKDPKLLLEQLLSLLKPNGKLYLTTPNSVHTKIKNPWHTKEFNLIEFQELTKIKNQTTKIYGLKPFELLKPYYLSASRNNRTINNLGINLLYKLPLSIQRYAYEIGNRIHRIILQTKYQKLFNELDSNGYSFDAPTQESLDFLAIIEKKNSNSHS